MPVRQHNCVHATEIDVKPVSISLDSVVFGARIKKDRLRVVLSPCRDHKRQPMVRTADRLPREHLQPMDYVAPHFRMNVFRIRGEPVGHIVHQDLNLHLLNSHQLGCPSVRGHRHSVLSSPLERQESRDAAKNNTLLQSTHGLSARDRVQCSENDTEDLCRGDL
jgi:hypothetical protein